MPSDPVEITWDENGVTVVYACELDYVDTRADRKAFEAGR